jgi:16S rRNA (cytidine1402-2'-O)-methyltransferase
MGLLFLKAIDERIFKMSGNTTTKDRGWLLPAHRKEPLKPGLYIVATPIGNMADISVRALDILNAADLVVCEDTRVSGKLLSYYGIKAELMAYNDHNADRKRGPILERLDEGGIVALISDAGTPLISDPGFKLVRTCYERGVHVTSLPGANAPLTALQLSGLPSDKFSFLGFMPPKQAARRKVFEEWRGVPSSLLIFESAPRLVDTLRDILCVLGDRDVAVVREMTKLFEESRRAPVSALVDFYEAQGAPKGEIVIVIAPGGAQQFSDDDLRVMLQKALKTMGTKEAAAAVAEQTGQKRKGLYALALEIAGNGKGK